MSREYKEQSPTFSLPVRSARRTKAQPEEALREKAQRPPGGLPGERWARHPVPTPASQKNSLWGELNELLSPPL